MNTHISLYVWLLCVCVCVGWGVNEREADRQNAFHNPNLCYFGNLFATPKLILGQNEYSSDRF